ncbi:MAG: MinD/ParA family protein [Micavibrio sp.]
MADMTTAERNSGDAAKANTPASPQTPATGMGKTPVAPAMRRGKNIIAVASGKGGVGKTWFSITLSHAMAKAGKKVLLFDGDLGLANIDIQIGVMPRRDLSDVVRGRMGLDKIIHRYEEGGFDIIAGRSGNGILSALPAQHLAMLRDQLLEIADNYDVVIVDLGAGIDRTLFMFCSAAARTLMIVNDESTSLTDSYAIIKRGSATGLSKHISIIINQAANLIEGERTYNTIKKACENFLRLTPPLAGVIRQDSRVKESIRYQTPILIRSPNADAAEDVQKIARHVMAGLAETRKTAASA